MSKFELNYSKIVDHIENIGVDPDLIKEFCEMTYDDNIQDIVAGYTLMASKEDIKNINSLIEEERDEELSVIVLYMIHLLNNENKFDIKMDSQNKEFEKTLMDGIINLKVCVSLLSLREKGLIEIDTSTTNWVNSLTEEGRKMSEEIIKNRKKE